MPEDRPTSERIRVLLLEDHRVLAESLAALLGADPQIEIAGICTTASEALTTALEVDPDVMVVDLRLPDGSGAGVVSALRELDARPGVVFLTADESSEALAEAIEVGGAAFLSKAAPPEVVLDSIKRVFAGEMLIRPEQIQRALNERRVARRRERERAMVVSSLTPREREVLALLVAGKDASAISRDRGIAILTVRAHLRSLLGKLDVHSQLEAVARAQALGLVDVRGQSLPPNN